MRGVSRAPASPAATSTHHHHSPSLPSHARQARLRTVLAVATPAGGMLITALAGRLLRDVASPRRLMHWPYELAPGDEAGDAVHVRGGAASAINAGARDLLPRSLSDVVGRIATISGVSGAAREAESDTLAQ
ncbi:hypothetical protein EV121DRAFT_297716 [Schizophyllum commune]